MTEQAHEPFAPIPMPGILDGSDHDRLEAARLGDEASAEQVRAALSQLLEALDRCSDYGRALWQELNAVAEYLREDLARGEHGVLHGEEQWRNWQRIYASVLRSLAGPAGDEGYGASQAQLEMQNHSQ